MMKSPSPIALVAAMVLGLCVIIGVAIERKITDVKELAGTWQGWATGQLTHPARVTSMSRTGKRSAVIGRS